MKYIFYFILISLALPTKAMIFNNSDSVKYRLYMYFACENQIKKITDYSIEIRTNGLIRELKPDSSGICLIPKSDSLYLLRVPILHYVSLAIDKTKELITDTITVPPIYMAPISRNYIGPTYYQYYKCGKPCNGFEDAYRSDGQLWQKGYFKIGKLKSLKTYYVGGLLESKIKMRLINGCDVSFNKSGKLTQRFSYFLFISHYKIYDKAKDKYISRFSFGRYK